MIGFSYNDTHLAALSMMYLAAGLERTVFEPGTRPEINPLKKAELNFSKGLKLFNIDGVEVWAINEKNAIKKANKLK